MKSASRTSLQRRWREACGILLAGAATAALLVACGGGDTSSPSGTATAQSFSTGPITGLGSIIVNGVRFDDSKAQVENDEDGSAHDAKELKLGMMVEVQAGKIDDSTARAAASVVRFGSEIVGPVALSDATAQTIKVLDQTIEIKSTTVFDDSLVGGFAALTVGKVVEIHALFDAASGHYVATRVEDETGATAFRLRGTISALDTTAKTFKIGGAIVNFGGIAAADLPALANDMKVRVRLQTAQVNSQWVAISVRSGLKRVEDHADARVRGLVTAFTSAQHFFVQGIEVDATNATFEPNAAAVKLGAIVEVRGAAANGVITATRVKVLTGDEDRGMNVELHGDVSALEATAKTFMLREVKIDFSKVATFKDGTAAQLINGAKVEVKGAWSADRSVLIAAIIEFES